MASVSYFLQSHENTLWCLLTHVLIYLKDFVFNALDYGAFTSLQGMDKMSDHGAVMWTPLEGSGVIMICCSMLEGFSC
jgi:hypothetical protein